MGSIEKTWQSAKKRRVLAWVRKDFLPLRHRFGEKTSCKGQLTISFQLVNSGKIISKDGRQVSTPYYYRAWTAFLHFLIRFTRADQRNEKGWDTLFHYALAGGNENWTEMNKKKEKYRWLEHWSEKWLFLQVSWGSNPDSARKAFWVLISEIAKNTRRTKTDAHLLFLLSTRCQTPNWYENKRGILFLRSVPWKVFGDTYWLTGLMNRVSRFSCAILLKPNACLGGICGH